MTTSLTRTDSNVHPPLPCVSLSPIAQIDGVDDISVCSPSTPHPTLDIPFSNHPPRRVRKTDYMMDRHKQVKKLVKGASGEDFIMEINSNKENVNIVCNTGFYSTVAVPALQNLAKSRVSLFGNISVHCQDIIGTLDNSLAQQTTILYFKLSRHTDSMGAVRIHLHHTVRKVQLQGGAVMPDQTTAPVWFVDNVLRDLFIRESRDKAESIRAFNQAIKSLKPSIGGGSGTKPGKCKGCDIQFNGRSSPEFCSHCGFLYHKYKCYPSSNHPCYSKNREEGSCSGVDTTRQHRTTAPPSSAASLSVRPWSVPAVQTGENGHPVSHCTATYLSVPPVRVAAEESVAPMAAPRQAPYHAIEGQAPSIQTTPPQPTLTQRQVITPPLTSLSGTSSSSLPGFHDMVSSSNNVAVTTLTTHVPSRAPVLPRLLPRSAPGQQHPVTGGSAGPLAQDTQITANDLGPSVQRRQATKKKKSLIPTDTTGVTLELNRVEISTLQARLQKQQVELNDLRFRNSILMERNKSLEEAKTKLIHDHYFQPSQPGPPSDPTHTQHGNVSQSVRTRKYCTHYCQPCCAPPPCCQHQINHADMRNNTSSVDPNNEILTWVLELREAVKILQSKYDMLEKSEANPTQPNLLPSQSTPETTLRSHQAVQDESPAVSPVESPAVSLDGFMFSGEESQNQLN